MLCKVGQTSNLTITCEQALQLWQSEPRGNMRASALACPFAFGSRVNSRDSSKWRGYSRASSTATGKKLLVSLFFLTVGKMVVVFFRLLSERLVQLCQKYPNLIVKYQQDIMDFISGLKNLGPTKEDFFVHLVRRIYITFWTRLGVVRCTITKQNRGRVVFIAVVVSNSARVPRMSTGYC